MQKMLISAMALALAGCAATPAMPDARARVLASMPDGTADQVAPPVISRKLIGPDGNTYQCSAYPGGLAVDACEQK